jgi:hypothetical protein
MTTYYEKNREKIIKKSNEYYHQHKNDPEYLEKRREYFNEKYYKKNKDFLLLKGALKNAKKTIEKLKVEKEPVIITKTVYKKRRKFVKGNLQSTEIEYFEDGTIKLEFP